MRCRECVEMLKSMRKGLYQTKTTTIYGAAMDEKMMEALSFFIQLGERLTEERIENILEHLAEKQMRAIIKAVDEKGYDVRNGMNSKKNATAIMATSWEDVDKKGGHLDFKVISQAILSELLKEE
jgi:hypothetical protein